MKQPIGPSTYGCIVVALIIWVALPAAHTKEQASKVTPRATVPRSKVGNVNESDTEKKLNIGQYYETKKDYRAAAIYYKSIPPDSPFYETAHLRLKQLLEMDPSLLKPRSTMPPIRL